MRKYQVRFGGGVRKRALVVTHLAPTLLDWKSNSRFDPMPCTGHSKCAHQNFQGLAGPRTVRQERRTRAYLVHADHVQT